MQMFYIKEPLTVKQPCIQRNLLPGYKADCTFAHVHQYLDSLNSKKCPLIYCKLVSQCTCLAEFLRSRGFKAEAYYSSLDKKLKEKIEDEWKTSDDMIIIGITI